jgi:hypothetical protein
VPAGGVTFAAELFGTGTLTLPTVIGTSPASSGNSGKYMGVVYTIDGDVPVDFEMTFSLDNGAVFAENPVLGVKDGAGSSGLNVSALSAGTMTLTGTTGLTTDAVFRFDSSANTNLYKWLLTGLIQLRLPTQVLRFYNWDQPRRRLLAHSPLQPSPPCNGVLN